MTKDHLTDSSFKPIGTIHSPYREKFAVPRQSGLVTAARAELHLSGECNREEILRGIEGFSHLWLIFVFHQVAGERWSPTVRPPRLGGNTRLGVFATRSPYRPNPLGLSAVKLEGVENRNGQWLLRLGGIDMVDGTPVLDIKPYIPYADAIPEAVGGFTENLAQAPVSVTFTPESKTSLALIADRYPGIEQLIEQVIGQHPQPGYQRHAPGNYGMTLYDLNIRWRATKEGYEVAVIEPLL